ncbi:DotG/IcmE/VirB10 family protein [Pseudomonas sp.]|uniref:DotG/IcmE/VirB10 family protein n=1 Tax=Pseudomonas sp. TaxID=306 RepID=UPI0029080554|nr:DotG/IcmE/VirB10 family protein [Pseudomonas sp.]MDU4254463.1 DotG/IcmE/VirB10 family protein [Pseudomonas sp.]
MSGINDDDLNLNADSTDRLGDKGYANQAYVGPVRGADGVKAVFAPANRKRLLAYVGAGALLVGACGWVFFSLEKNEVVQGGSGKVQAQRIQTDANRQPTQAQYDEAERYNQEELPKEQQTNPTAHPVLVTEPADNGNPFRKQTELNRPRRVSETGSTHEQQAPSTAGASASRGSSQANTNNMDKLIQQLIDAEGSKTPDDGSVDWEYRTVASNNDSAADQESVAGKGTEAADEAGSGKCKNPATRAATMYMATTDLALNSDVGGDVALTIRNGRLRGTQLLGKFERKEEWLRMDLTKLVTPTDTVNVKAIGLDMETTLNAVQGEVDSHLLYRYGWWGFGTVLKAVGKAAELNADQDVVVSDGTVVQNTQASSSRELKLALGSLGQDMGKAFQDRLDRPITVSLKVNDEVGVFFLDDVCLPDTKGF